MWQHHQFFLSIPEQDELSHHLRVLDNDRVNPRCCETAGHNETSLDKWEPRTCAMVGDPRERLRRESWRLFVVKRRLGRCFLMVTWICDRFLSGQDQRRLNGVLLGADPTVHRGPELNARWTKEKEKKDRIRNYAGDTMDFWGRLHLKVSQRQWGGFKHFNSRTLSAQTRGATMLVMQCYKNVSPWQCPAGWRVVRDRILMATVRFKMLLTNGALHRSPSGSRISTLQKSI